MKSDHRNKSSSAYLDGPFNTLTMRSRTILPLLALLVIGTSATAQPIVSGTLNYGGALREYRLYIPAIYNPATPVPLVFNLHGYGSNMQQQEFYGDFKPIADTANFIIVHPNGLLDGTGTRFWNTFGSSTTVDDLGFLTALLDEISTNYSIDQDRVYSTGMSNGGFMSHDLACFRSERFAAIASVTGTMISPRLSNCASTHPMPVMQIHGTADATVPYAGGSGFVPVETLVGHWVDFNNCSPTPSVTPVPNTNTTDGCTAERLVYSGGDAGSTVEFFRVLDGAHTWPGAVFNTGVTNQDFKASVEIWRFFSQYRLSELATGVADVRPNGFNIAPNPSNDAFQLRFATAGPRTITVHNATGQRLLELRATGTEARVEPEGSGLFLVTVVENGSIHTQRVLKL